MKTGAAGAFKAKTPPKISHVLALEVDRGFDLIHVGERIRSVVMF